jgi:hypothetical protein
VATGELEKILFTISYHLQIVIVILNGKYMFILVKPTYIKIKVVILDDLKKRKYLSFWTAYTGEVCLLFKEDGKKKVEKVNYMPYFFLKEKEYESKESILPQEFFKLAENIEKDGDWLKVYYSYGNHDRLERIMKEANLDTYQLDLKPDKLLFLDLGLEMEDEYTVLFFDIETDDRTGGLEIGKSRITSFSGVGSDGQKYVFCLDSELEIIRNVKEVFNKYDVVVGWNSRK